MIGVVAMTVISVLGRYLFNTPIPGDYELTELACGIAVFAFFAHCHARSGNIVVEFFTGRLRARHKTALATVHNIAFHAGCRPDHMAPVRRRHAQAPLTARRRCSWAFRCIGPTSRRCLEPDC